MRAVHTRECRRGFTLVELLVVIAIIAVLAGLLLATAEQVRKRARQAVCMSNLQQIGVAIRNYSTDYNDAIPFGPAGPGAPPYSAVNFYPRWGVLTSLISDEDSANPALSGAPVGLGLMINSYLSSNPNVLFCPDVDQGNIADMELAIFNAGQNQAQCDYYYRHASWIAPAFNPNLATLQLKLSNLGVNSAGYPIRALVIDVSFIAPPQLAAFGGYTRTCHGGTNVNCLYSDGHVDRLDNLNNAYTVNATSNIEESFGKIRQVFETAEQP